MSDLAKFLYVSSVSGQVIKVPLRGSIDRGDVLRRLLNAGVDPNEFRYLSYSTVEPAPKLPARSQIPKRHEIERLLEQPFPLQPVPAAADLWPSSWSELQVRKFTPLKDLLAFNLPFCMSDNAGSKVNIWSYAPDKFKDRSQWTRFSLGRSGYSTEWPGISCIAGGSPGPIC